MNERKERKRESVRYASFHLTAVESPLTRQSSPEGCCNKSHLASLGQIKEVIVFFLLLSTLPVAGGPSLKAKLKSSRRFYFSNPRLNLMYVELGA